VTGALASSPSVAAAVVAVEQVEGWLSPDQALRLGHAAARIDRKSVV